MNAALERLYRREDLEAAELETLFTQLIAGKLDPVLLTALLVTLKVKANADSRLPRLRAPCVPRPGRFHVRTTCSPIPAAPAATEKAH